MHNDPSYQRYAYRAQRSRWRTFYDMHAALIWVSIGLLVGALLFR